MIPDDPDFAARRLAARARLDAIDDKGASDPTDGKPHWHALFRRPA